MFSVTNQKPAIDLQGGIYLLSLLRQIKSRYQINTPESENLRSSLPANTEFP
jgi:hypothetical protein